jgi:hypothetical protein
MPPRLKFCYDHNQAKLQLKQGESLEVEDPQGAASKIILQMAPKLIAKDS